MSDATGRRRAPVPTWTLVTGFAAVAAFLVTRFAFLDRDLPPWNLAMYQPIDESAYTIPAFNLHHYGTWTHQDVPWVPLEGSPMNVVQSLVTSWTLALDWTYWGFRASSVLFGLVAFLAILATARHLVRQAQDERLDLPFPGAAILGAVVLLLLVDFSFLMGGRVVEATIPRLAEVALLLWLVARGTFLGPGHSAARSVALGLLTGLAVGFGYIYNAFMLPGVLLAVGVWAWSRTSRRDVVRHVVLAGAGMALAIGLYFGWVYLVYGHSPGAWYDTWLSTYRVAGRAATFDLAGLWDLVLGNIFRLDRPLMALSLITLPVFAWWARRSRDPLAITVLALAVAFAAQATVQSDYPQRKMLLLLVFAVPVAVGGLLRLHDFSAWAAAGRARLGAWVAWVGLVTLGTLALAIPRGWNAVHRWLDALNPPATSEVMYHVGSIGTLLVGGAIVGLAALVVMIAGWRRPPVARVAGIVLLLAMMGPLLAIDRRYVFTHVTTDYRDAMVSVGALPDAAVTAVDGHAMQLYNDSESVLQGNVFGMTIPEYEAAVVRYFAEGRARWMFAYAGDAGIARWAPLGFRLVETYPMRLPKGRVLGRYEYVGPAAPRS